MSISDVMEKEFDRQVETLLAKGYPALLGKSKEQFLEDIAPLKALLPPSEDSDVDIEKGHVPFVLVAKAEKETDALMTQVVREGKEGITKLYPLVPADFHTIESVQIPAGNIYLLIDIDRGKETLNVRPADALVSIQKAHRSPLTIDEGIAMVTQYPEFLQRNNCFSLLASRHAGDKRVPAIWLNAKNHPNLGWCWDGNPHTWLGSASCGSRVSVEV